MLKAMLCKKYYPMRVIKNFINHLRKTDMSNCSCPDTHSSSVPSGLMAFDLGKALSGKFTVVLRDGRELTKLCVREGFPTTSSDVLLTEHSSGLQGTRYINGKKRSSGNHDWDLFLKAKKVKAVMYVERSINSNNSFDTSNAVPLDKEYNLAHLRGNSKYQRVELEINAA